MTGTQGYKGHKDNGGKQQGWKIEMNHKKQNEEHQRTWSKQER